MMDSIGWGKTVRLRKSCSIVRFGNGPKGSRHLPNIPRPPADWMDGGIFLKWFGCADHLGFPSVCLTSKKLRIRWQWTGCLSVAWPKRSRSFPMPPRILILAYQSRAFHRRTQFSFRVFLPMLFSGMPSAAEKLRTSPWMTIKTVIPNTFAVLGRSLQAGVFSKVCVRRWNKMRMNRQILRWPSTSCQHAAARTQWRTPIALILQHVVIQLFLYFFQS